MSVSMIGLDTAKSVFQVHAVDQAGKPEIKRKLRRSEVIPFFEQQDACTVVLEACGAAHHWARMLVGQGQSLRAGRYPIGGPLVWRSVEVDHATLNRWERQAKVDRCRE